jgi:hypothetical protein
MQDRVERSAYIFAGTVASVRPEKVRYSIATRVRFDDLTFVLGSSESGALELLLDGGKLGDREVFCPGQPQFTEGQRYIVMAHKDLGSLHNSYMPLVGLSQGVFHVFKYAKGENEVSDWQERKVVEIEDYRLVVVESRRALGSKDSNGRPTTYSSPGTTISTVILSPGQDPGTRISEEGFLTRLRELVGSD